MNLHLIVNRILFLGCFFSTPAYAQIPDSTDNSKNYSLLITPRVHSTGHFPYTGAYVNHNTVVDLNVYYERNGIGTFAFKSQGLGDNHSVINYGQLGICTPLSINDKLKVTPYVGYLFSQAKGFRDKNSDFWSGIVIRYKVGTYLVLENTALFLNLTEPELDAAFNNRSHAEITVGKFKFDLLLWYRNNFINHVQNVSGALAINFPPVKISDQISIRNVLAMQSYLTKEKPSFAMHRELLYSLVIPMNLSCESSIFKK